MAYAFNKKAIFNYELLEKFEAGIELLGFEVKSIKAKNVSFEGAFVGIRGGEAFLMSAHIPPYQTANTPKNYDPYRARRLLLSKKELKTLADSEKQRGLTIVPISMYSKGRRIKLELAIARGKKKYDKRESIKKKDQQQDIEREAKARFK